MKKFFIEYANLVGMTVIGLVFGLSFFLLFINFYHYKETNATYSPKVEGQTDYEKMMMQVNTIKENTAAYQQSSYHGTENLYDMLSIQAKLKFCMVGYESDKLKDLLQKDTYGIQDIYELVTYYQNEILNDCVVLQLYNLGDANSTPIQSERLKSIAPFLKSQMDLMLVNGVGYLRNNIRNNDIYYFSNEDSKNTVFDLTKDSYHEIISRYKSVLDFLQTFSNWYKTIALGG